MPTDLPRLLNTLWGAFLDTAESFSCIEIEAIADLYRDTGWTEEQVRPLLVAHAEDDDEGDGETAHGGDPRAVADGDGPVNPPQDQGAARAEIRSPKRPAVRQAVRRRSGAVRPR